MCEVHVYPLCMCVCDNPLWHYDAAWSVFPAEDLWCERTELWAAATLAAVIRWMSGPASLHELDIQQPIMAT